MSGIGKMQERDEDRAVREVSEADGGVRLMVLLELIGRYLGEESALSGRIVDAACEEVQKIWQKEREKAEAERRDAQAG